jgi:tRNA pseudouridine38-40 synthase
MPRYRIDLSYDGTAYAGWQVQPNGVTVQATVEDALRELTGAAVRVHGSGRTDQGVHARGQTAHFDLATALSRETLVRGLNALLPADVRVGRAARVAPDFHARRSATGKEYRYFIWNGPVLPPTVRQYRTHVRDPLDTERMNRAAAVLKGRHDFAAFAANPNRVVESTVRHLRELRVVRRGREVTVIARADGFLYKMVRSLVGFLLRVGEGAVPPSHARAILASRTRTARVPTAPPQGLFLWRVWYGAGGSARAATG